MGDPTIRVSSENKEFLDNVKEKWDLDSMDDVVSRLIDVYSPFMNDKVSNALWTIAKDLERISEEKGISLIEKKSEAEIVNYALKVLMTSWPQIRGQLERRKPEELKPERGGGKVARKGEGRKAR